MPPTVETDNHVLHKDPASRQASLPLSEDESRAKKKSRMGVRVACDKCRQRKAGVSSHHKSTRLKSLHSESWLDICSATAKGLPVGDVPDES